MKKLISLLLALSMVFALTACGSSSSSSSGSSGSAASTSTSEGSGDATTDTDSDSYKVLKVAMDVEPTGLGPDDTADGLGCMFVSYSIFGTLWMLTADGETTNILAESYGYNEDGSEFTIVLRDDIYFADGNPITAEDVLYTFQLAAAGTGSMRVAALDLDNAVVVDDQTLTIPMLSETATLIEDLNILMIREKSWSEQSDENLSLNVVSSGAYTIDSWETGMGITLVKNEYYFDIDNVYYDEVQISFIGNEETRLLSFENGDYDIICLSTSSAIDEINDGAREGATIVTAPLQSISGLALNTIDFDTFSDQNVRQAIGYAIDTETLVESVLGSAYTAATSSVLPSANYAYLNTGNYEYDLEKAQALMEEAGYSEDNLFSFTMTVSQSDTNEALAEAIQYMLSLAYIDMAIDTQDGATYMNNMIANTIEAGFSTYLGSYEPAGIINARRPNIPANMSKFGDDDLEAFLEECCTATGDEDEIIEMWHELQERAYEYASMIPLYESNQNFAVADSVDTSTVTGSVQADGYLFATNLKGTD